MRSLKRRGRGRGAERAGHGERADVDGSDDKHGDGGSDDCINGRDTGEVWGRYAADEVGESASIAPTASGRCWTLAEQGVTDQST